VLGFSTTKEFYLFIYFVEGISGGIGNEFSRMRT